MSPTTTAPVPTIEDKPPGNPSDDEQTCPRARADVAAMPTDRLEATLLTLAQHLATGTYELLVLVGEVDARGIWAAWGTLSCAAWLADVSDIDIGTARRQVRVARALRDHPVLDAAMRGGDVSYAKARVLISTLDATNAEALVAIARVTPAGRLGAAIAAWTQAHDDQDVIAQRQHDARSMSWRTDPDGTVVITARLTPEAAGQLCAVVDTNVTRSDVPAGTTLAQQRADALVTAVTSGGGDFTAEVVVHVREDGNTLTDGTPLADHAVTTMLPDAFVSLLVHDSQRQPVDASPRRRFPTRRQRRVIDETNPECAQPGCHARAFLEYDHVRPFSHGGATVIANLQRLCGPHNRAKNPRTPGHGS